MTDIQERPLAERTVMVHKHDAEGALIINALDGLIVSPLDERPDWAEGLCCALLMERCAYYHSRLGPDAVKDHFGKEEAIAFEDLGWLAIDAEGEAIELEADAEHRMNVIAEYAGITRVDDLELEAPVKGSKVTEVFVDMGTEYDPEEAHALEKAQSSTFEQATGTNGKS